MDKYTARANIDHYLNLLTSAGLSDRNRATIMKLMVEEEDKLGHDLEQLEFAESRTAQCRDRVNHVKNLRDGFVDGSTERNHADRLLDNFEAIHRSFERFCHELHKSANLRRL